MSAVGAASTPGLPWPPEKPTATMPRSEGWVRNLEGMSEVLSLPKEGPLPEGRAVTAGVDMVLKGWVVEEVLPLVGGGESSTREGDIGLGGDVNVDAVGCLVESVAMVIVSARGDAAEDC